MCCSSTSTTPPRVLYNTSRQAPKEQDEEYSKRWGVEVKWVDKETLAQQGDVVILLCGLNDSTRGIVGEEFLGKMKKTAVLINVARVSEGKSFLLEIDLFNKRKRNSYSSSSYFNRVQ